METNCVRVMEFRQKLGDLGHSLGQIRLLFLDLGKLGGKARNW
jgi:hypothetical protein